MVLFFSNWTNRYYTQTYSTTIIRKTISKTHALFFLFWIDGFSSFLSTSNWLPAIFSLQIDIFAQIIEQFANLHTQSESQSLSDWICISFDPRSHSNEFHNQASIIFLLTFLVRGGNIEKQIVCVCINRSYRHFVSANTEHGSIISNWNGNIQSWWAIDHSNFQTQKVLQMGQSTRNCDFPTAFHVHAKFKISFFQLNLLNWRGWHFAE